MDELEKRLRQDAANIDSAVPPALTARIRARLAGAARPVPRRAPSPFRLWAAASLSGMAATLLVVLLLPDASPPEPRPLAHRAPVPADIARDFPLVVETAQLTAPLEQELENLKADIEKAREKVERDLDF